MKFHEYCPLYQPPNPPYNQVLTLRIHVVDTFELTRFCNTFTLQRSLVAVETDKEKLETDLLKQQEKSDMLQSQVPTE